MIITGRLQVRPDAGGRPPDRRRAPGRAGQRGSAAAVRRLDQRRPARDGAVGGERRAGAEGGHRARGGSRGGDVLRVQRPPPPAGDRCRRRARPARRGDRPLDAQEPQHRAAARPRAGARGPAGVAQGDRELPRRAARDADDRQPGRAAVGAAADGASGAPAGEAPLRRHDHLLGDADPGQRAGRERDGGPPLPDRRDRDHDPGRGGARVRARLVRGDQADAEPHQAALRDADPRRPQAAAPARQAGRGGRASHPEAIFKGRNGLPLEIDERGARFGEQEQAASCSWTASRWGTSRTSRCATAARCRRTGSSSWSRPCPARTAVRSRRPRSSPAACRS